jgi:hypothetical protein
MNYTLKRSCNVTITVTKDGSPHLNSSDFAAAAQEGPQLSRPAVCGV